MSQIIVIGAGIGGLTVAALLAQVGFEVTVLEAQPYPGGSAGTFFHKGYRFDAGATVAGGFQSNGPHTLIGDRLGLRWPVKPHEPAWVVHLPDRTVALTRDNRDVLRHFPETSLFWEEQAALADVGWALAADGLPWPPSGADEWLKLAKVAAKHFPRDLRLAPFALITTRQWLRLRGLAGNEAFIRFIDAQLLISAQTTSQAANAAYSATALDLARQGIYHVQGGIGALAEALIGKVIDFGGRVLYRHRVERIDVENGRAIAVRTQKGQVFPADFVIANLVPPSLDQLLGENSPALLRREVRQLRAGWGAFVLHLGLRSDRLPPDLPDHHQVITTMRGALGEGRSIFLSLSPLWDTTRAPVGMRAATVTTHTAVQPWWDLLARDSAAYSERKAEYTERMLDALERAIPGFRSAVDLILPGTPVTYAFYTGRHLGLVGGLPQTSLLRARGPLTGIANLRLVGDAIFPGQSTAGVSLGALRVFEDVRRRVQPAGRFLSLPARTIDQAGD